MNMGKNRIEGSICGYCGELHINLDIKEYHTGMQGVSGLVLWVQCQNCGCTGKMEYTIDTQKVIDNVEWDDWWNKKEE
tara:strand:- start:1156 stop:1389 length:234 start_codon:yes stop_codon:yes gene_type:complete